MVRVFQVAFIKQFNKGKFSIIAQYGHRLAEKRNYFRVLALVYSGGKTKSYLRLDGLIDRILFQQGSPFSVITLVLMEDLVSFNSY